MKFVVSDPKSGKAYSAQSETALFVGKKLGDTVGLDEIGLTGFEAKITGGSGNQGFPMHPSVVGSIRKKIFTSGGIGFKSDRKGMKRRISVLGSQITKDTSQINLVVTKAGSVDLQAVLGNKEMTEEEKMSAKERLIKKSLETAGSADLGSGVKKAKH
ncbi:MAG: S6e family ribosomal protein [archaeon]